MNETIGQAAQRAVGNLNSWVRVRSQGRLYRIHPDRPARDKHDIERPISTWPKGSRLIVNYEYLPMIVEVL